MKNPVFYRCLDYFRRLDEIKIDELLPKSKDPPNDVLMYWGSDVRFGFHARKPGTCHDVGSVSSDRSSRWFDGQETVSSRGICASRECTGGVSAAKL